MLIGQGSIIPCFRCKEPITEEDVRTGNVEKEHLHEVELGGADDPSNWRFSHKAKPCHATVTHGNGATFAGSSRHRIAKATDPARIEKFAINKPGPQPAIPPVLKLQQMVDAEQRCRGCGEFGKACTCAPKAQPSGLRRRFA